MTEVPTWGAPTVPAETTPTPGPHGPEVEDCGGTCAACQVKTAGARAIAHAIGVNYDTATPDEQAHLRHLAGHVYADMSEAILTIPGIKSLATGQLAAAGSVEVSQ